MKVALLQYCAGADKPANLLKALALSQEAIEGGAQWMLLPEVFNFRGDSRNKEVFAGATESIPGPSTEAFSALAKKYKVSFLLGSILEKASRARAYNTSVFIDPRGKIVAKYRKIHLFDARIDDKIVREADCFLAGRRPVTAKIGEFRMGLSVCYDLRFPGLYQSYARKGVEILTVPSCFTKKTGEAHWEALLRDRAIENLSYVLAPNQVGIDARGLQAYGHSMIISPWGEVIARGSGGGEEIIYGEIDMEKIIKARSILPGIIKGEGMMAKRVKVAVTGAAGQIGYALLFRIAAGEMFGADTEVDLSLLELEKALPALSGVVMELDDCAFPLLREVTVTADPNTAFKDIDWALLVGSVPRKEGMERGDLLKINGGVFTVQGKALSAYAKPGCKVLVVGNPCNTNAFIAKAVCKNIEAKNFFAMTMLDENRAAAQLARKAGVPVNQVKNVAIWGNHSATQYPDFYNATIGGRPAAERITDDAWLKGAFIETVQKRGAAVIKARGLSSAASAANAVIDTVRNITTPTPAGEFFSAAVSSDGSYGIEPGIMFGFPLRSNGSECSIVGGLKHNEFAQSKIKATLDELLAEKAAVAELILLQK